MLMATTLFRCLENLYKCNSMLSNIGIGTFGNSDVTVFFNYKFKK
ncbi:hypothetical protein SAMN05444143_11367 [Flavobacterium succinicans]|jgi:hypothetical protein|uniref:Uncharacterized protein n=1 Tax=Flavobacterium succinicans TaxID=29536 RepID=A0A1I4Z3I3_9FLAO|nr:hypothetical protein SAMN05444143_11367 [Flavobacterium succinicans]